MPEIPKAILDAGAVVTVLFLVALLVYFILLIIKAVKPKPAEASASTESTGPGGMYRRPSCAYLEASVLQRDRVGRIEVTTKETNELVKAMGGAMERVAESSEKSEELLGKMLEAMIKRGASG